MIFKLKPSIYEETLEPIVGLELRHDKQFVDVVAIFQDNSEQSILSFLPDGRFHRCLNVEKGNGFKINKYGQIVECKNL